MKIKHLFKSIPDCQIKGSKETIISGISANSKAIAPGYLFVAKKGKVFNGSQFIQEAIQGGAAAVLTDLYDPSLKNIVQVIHPHVNEIEAVLAAEFYQNPSKEMVMVGITGTNGKTTTSFLIKALMESFIGPCGLIGTIEYQIGPLRHQAPRTTPDVTTNHKFLREMVQHGCCGAVMEVTSHALDQGRVDEIEYDIAVFSNLTWDHLDYHRTMEEYCQAKNLLFRNLGKKKGKKGHIKRAVINLDSPWAQKIVEGTAASQLTYAIEAEADLKASNIRMDKLGTHSTVTYQGNSYECYWPLIGRFNVYNCLAAIGALLAMGIPLEKIAAKMGAMPPVRGRLEPVQNKLGLKIYVDYAHTDDALENVLKTLQEVKNRGKIISVFGCGGDRDTDKRPKMGAVSEKYADFSFITSDNPRSEDPLSICQSVARGFRNSQKYAIELDRRAAIRRAIEMATQDDLILIAGKGHENYQIFAHQTIEFDDVQVAADLCADAVVGGVR